VVLVPVKWYNVVTGGLCIGLRILELFELIISVLLTFCRAAGGCSDYLIHCTILYGINTTGMTHLKASICVGIAVGPNTDFEGRRKTTIEVVECSCSQ